ncbi:MAG: polymerase, sigma-24 subunit, subfamily [Actinoallomurus sp.]|nr:polymerase, sigma-24 subunit, subfamily [Actinoallomurus sp.]
MSLTEALRGGAPETFGVLYDEHSERLYAYCHIMVGDEAADAVRDAFIAVARHPGTAPHDDAALPVWLHALARAECVRRGALVRKIVATPSADPLRRVLARLRPEHREVLALSATLEPAEIARVVGVARDTAEMLVQVSRRRLEEAVVSALGALPDETVLAALTSGDLHTLVMRGYEPPPRQRERVLFSCVAAERAPDGALLFDQDGMPIPLDALFSAADDPTHPFRQVGLEEPLTAPLRQIDASAAESGGGPRTVRISHARPKKQPFLTRRRDGLFEVAGLAACVAAATGVLALWPSPHPNGAASNVDGTSLFLHHPGTASRSVQPAPAWNETPPQAATSKPGTSPSPTPTKAGTAPTTAPPNTTAAAAQPTSPPAGGSGPAAPSHPTPPASPTPPTSPPDSPTTTPTPPAGPTPSETPTDSPTPDPSTP